MNLTQLLHWSGAGKDGLHHRYNPLAQQWIPVNHQRYGRPVLILDEDVPPEVGFCPFCWDYFDKELNKILVDDSDKTEGGVVIANAWPYAAGKISPPQREGAPEGGAAEVVICRRHVSRFEELNQEEARWLIGAWVARIGEDRGQHAYSVGFMNEGAHSGATIPHLHAQVLALGYPIGVYRNERREDGDECIVCVVREFETQRGTRLVYAKDGISAWVPWWMDAHQEVIIAPDEHNTTIPPGIIDALAVGSWEVGRTLRSTLGSRSRRWVLHISEKDNIHWHMHIYSVGGRLSTSGIDMAIGIQDTSPERFAGFLRTAG